MKSSTACWDRSSTSSKFIPLEKSQRRHFTVGQSILIAIVVMFGFLRHSQAQVVFSEDFNDYQIDGDNNSQFDTGLQIHARGTFPGWTGGGVNNSHAVDLNPSDPGTNYALMLFSGNSSQPPNTPTLNTPIAANALGVEYDVTFDSGPSVYVGPSQATASTDGINVEIVRPDQSMVASYTHQPGAWPGTPNSQDLNSPGEFTYVGDGSGNVTIVLATSPILSGRFGGALDNLRVTVVSLPSFWTGISSTAWSDSGNWSGAVPGATTGTANTDTATFNQAAPNSPSTLDAGRNIQSITFDTANVTAVTIGTVDGNSLLLAAGGAIHTTSTVVNPQTVNCPLVLEGDYTFSSGAASSSATLTVGGGIIPGATSGLTTLTLSGSNSGVNTISGVLADNGSGQLAIAKNGTGAWTLSGANTFGGTTTVINGALRLAGGSVNNIPNSPTINVASGATLDVTGLANSTLVLGSGNIAETLIGTGTVNGSVAVSGGLENGSGNAPVASAISSGTGNTLTINGGLTLQNGSIANFTLGAPNGAGKPLGAFVNVTGTAGLAVNGIHTVNFSGTAQLGTYELFAFTSGGPLASQFTMGTNGAGILSYSFAVTPNSEVDLIVTLTSAAWDFNGAGNYSDSSKWHPSVVPSGAGVPVTFGNGVVNTVNASSIPVLVNGAEVAGSLVFNNTNSARYDLTNDGISGHGITLNNNGGGANINVSANALQIILANLTLADNLACSINAGSVLSIGGNVNQSGGSRTLTVNGPGTLTLGGANTYSGGTVINSGTLNTTINGTLGSGPLTINAANATSTLNLNANQTVSSLTSSGSGGGSAVVNVASGRTLVLTGALTSSGNLNLTGPGTTEIDGAPTLNANSVITVTNGTLRFAATSGSPTIGTGVTSTVGAGATLELAGSVASLSSGTNRVNINTLANSNGILVSGTHQQVGNIDGAGTTQVNAGSHVTANHIIQGALVISGSSGNLGRVTITASDAAGNPLGQSLALPSGLGLTGSLASSSSLGDGVNSPGGRERPSWSSLGSSADATGISPTAGKGAEVPEPSTMMMLVVALVSLLVRARHARGLIASQRTQST
jgi:autotransporter-associated beta strand protein